jgi:hypothetical protein
MLSNRLCRSGAPPRPGSDKRIFVQRHSKQMERSEGRQARSTYISRIWRPCEPMVSSPSKTCRTSSGLRLSTSRMCTMAQKVARSTETNSRYESRAETEAAVERIHECFKHIRAAIAKEKVERTSAAADSHRGQPRSALDLPAKI